MDAGIGGVEHAREDSPVAAFDLHCPFDRHTDHRFKAVDEVEVLAVVHSGTCLDDVGSERRTNLGMLSIV